MAVSEISTQTDRVLYWIILQCTKLQISRHYKATHSLTQVRVTG